MCWGQGGDGALGNDSTSDSLVPVAVKGLKPGVQAIAAAGGHSCALVDGGVFCWGANFAGQLGRSAMFNSSIPMAAEGFTSGVEAVAAGYHHTCVIKNGGAYCWGLNDNGQLGRPTEDRSDGPTLVPGLPLRVQSLALGWTHIDGACAPLLNARSLAAPREILDDHSRNHNRHSLYSNGGVGIGTRRALCNLSEANQRGPALRLSPID